jgi:hypothetical protein
MDNGRRSDAGREQGVEANGGVLGAPAQIGVKKNVPAAFGLHMKHGAGRHGKAEHLLQTESLGAELDLIVVPLPAFTAFIFHGKRRLRQPGRARMKLNKIGDANDSQAMADEPQAASGTKRRLVTVALGVNATVIERTGGGVDIVKPYTLNAKEGAATRTE